MSTTRRRPDRNATTIAATLATAARDVRRAVRAADASQAPGLQRLCDTGWQLTQLTGELTELIALLAEHTGRHTELAAQQPPADGGEPTIEHLARACRELAALRQTLEAAHTAARNYYTAMSQLRPMHASNRPQRSP